MRLKHPFFSLLLLLTALSLVWASNRAHSMGRDYPTSVGLVGFSAATHANGVLLTWETATELNTAGFIFHRRTGSGPFAYLENIGFVDAEGGPALGNIYQEIDDTAVTGQTYTYQLIEVEYSGDEFILEEVTITVGGTPTPTPSPTRQATATPSSTAPSSATATPSPTSSATTPPQTASTATPLPTATTALPVGTRFTNPTAASPTAVSNPTTIPFSPTSLPDTPAANSVTDSPDQTKVAPPPTDGSTSDSLNMPPMVTTPNNQVASGDSSVFAQEGYDPSANEGYTAPQNTPIPIGSDRLNQVMPTPPGGYPPAAEAAPQGRLLLWGGFLLALIIFGSSIVGSIILFTRKQIRY